MRLLVWLYVSSMERYAGLTHAGLNCHLLLFSHQEFAHESRAGRNGLDSRLHGGTEDRGRKRDDESGRIGTGRVETTFLTLPVHQASWPDAGPSVMPDRRLQFRTVSYGESKRVRAGFRMEIPDRIQDGNSGPDSERNFERNALP